jgi:hypothetical protein
MRDARRRRCERIADDEQRSSRRATTTSPKGYGRDDRICGVRTPRRCYGIASSPFLASAAVAPATRAALDFFTASQDDTWFMLRENDVSRHSGARDELCHDDLKLKASKDLRSGTV